MFGNEYDIVREFNVFFLDYQEQYDADTRWTDRIISSSGDWSGNVYDFYFRVYNKLVQDMKVHLSVRMMCLAWRTGIKLSHIQFFPSCPSLRNVILGE